MEEKDGFYWTRSALEATAAAGVLFVGFVVVSFIASAIASAVANAAVPGVGGAISISGGFCCFIPVAFIPPIVLMMYRSVKEMDRMQGAAMAGVLSWPISAGIILVGMAATAVMAALVYQSSSGTGHELDYANWAYYAATVTLLVGVAVHQVGLTAYIWRIMSPVGRVCIPILDAAYCAVAAPLVWLSVVLAMAAAFFLSVGVNPPADADPFGVIFAFLFGLLAILALFLVVLAILLLHAGLLALKALLARRWLGSFKERGDSGAVAPPGTQDG